MYIDILRHLGVAVRRKSPEKWRANSWFLLPDIAPTHRSVLVKVVLAKNVTTLEHPSHSPDLAPADFYTSHPLKSALKGRSFCDATDVIKNVTEELNRLSQNDFQGCSKHLQSLAEMYSCARVLF